jgi:hypothetical protein
MGGLTDEVEISMHYGTAVADDDKIMDFGTRQLESVSEIGHTNGSFMTRKMKLVMSSGILAANPGSQTGELLVGYPFSAVSTSQSTESMLLKLRVYLGSVLYRPENILILPHIAFEGVTSGYKVAGATNEDKDAFWECALAGMPLAFQEEVKKPYANMMNVALALTKLDFADDTALKSADSAGTKTGGSGDWIGIVGAGKAFYVKDKKVIFDESNAPFNTVISRGYSTDKDGKEKTSNVGYLGCIDSPQCADRVWGTAGGQVYKADPNRV